MSMSQEEIEALMSGAGDIAQDDEELQAEGSEQGVSSESTEDNLDNLDDILSGIDGIVDDDVTEAEPKVTTNESSEDADKKIENLIEQSQYPFPAKDENKVVNQLSQVADDSEEKASQIFDVLSFILDENSEIQNYNRDMGVFIKEQITLLESLSVKFPNIAVFNENLEKAKELLESSKDLDNKVNVENNKIFEAMELMQYHDINRQKIERVMSVIKKLNSYLNGIFVDESDKPDVQIAKHISGDSNEIVDADDIEALISDFQTK